MRDCMKRVFSFILAVCFVLSLTQIVTFADDESVTIEELQLKYPHGAYWNGGDPESYTLTPCDHHTDCDISGSCGCNSFRGLGIQCLGFAYQLATLVYGGNQYLERTPIYDSSALDELKAGDIIRYRNGTHSIFVTSVDGDIVTFADCNSDHHCVIRWEQTTTKDAIKATFTYLDPAPYAWVSGEGCDCSRAYDGNYKCVTGGSTLNIRSGHGTSHSIIGSIPDGAIVFVSKGNGKWAHVYYNGISGYASMDYLELQHTHAYDLFYEEEHPHKEFYQCECGDWYYTGDLIETEECGSCRAEICKRNGHIYDNDCDTTCDFCGDKREVFHFFDNACDADCNECGELREVEEHVYDNACDKACNECSTERETTHVYDNSCDDECNECLELREASEHQYDDDHDAECNECGFTREVPIPGDVNGDKAVSNKDLSLLRQYLNGWDVEIDLSASDVNADGVVSNKDLSLLRQFLNGWDVVLK